MYALYQGRPLSSQGMFFRQDWADKLGLSAPQNVDELYAMIEKFTNEDPDGNGKKDTIGLAVLQREDGLLPYRLRRREPCSSRFSW